TIDRTRTAVHAVPGANAIVGGSTAINLDVQNASAHDRNLIIPLILVVVLVILGVLLRSLVAPLILTATVVLSCSGAAGVGALFSNPALGSAGADPGCLRLVLVSRAASGIAYTVFRLPGVRGERIGRAAGTGPSSASRPPAESSPRRAWSWPARS